MRTLLIPLAVLVGVMSLAGCGEDALTEEQIREIIRDENARPTATAKPTATPFRLPTATPRPASWGTYGLDRLSRWLHLNLDGIACMPIEDKDTFPATATDDELAEMYPMPCPTATPKPTLSPEEKLERRRETRERLRKRDEEAGKIAPYRFEGIFER